MLVCTGCGSRVIEHADFAPFFDEYGVEGAFILYDRSADTYHIFNPERCRASFLPASTFKILNSLIALETGVIEDENEVFPWDGSDYGFAEWNTDHSMRTAIQVSAVWFYQELARRIGFARMQDYVTQVGYGNRDITGNLDSFWLDGALRISPEEQVAFLQRLYEDALPFSDETMATVRDILVVEETADYRLSAKSGWVTRVEPQIGWYVGYLERDGNVYFFAANIETSRPDERFGPAKIAITRALLRTLGLLPQ